MKLEFPRFKGDNPLGWVYKAHQFFQLYGTPPNQKILLASYHMEEEALIWFQEVEEAGQFTSWEAFVRSLHVRFGSLAYYNLLETLTRLRRVGNVVVYKGQFEALSNRIKELSEKHKLSCFLSGLKDEIRLPVRMFNPQNLNATFGLAKIQEENLLASRRNTKSWGKGPKASILGPSPMTKNDPKTSKMAIQKISPSQMEDRRKKGLCYYCDDKWFMGHKCKAPKIFYMEGFPTMGCQSGQDLQLKDVCDELVSHLDLQHEVDRIPEGVAKVTLYALLGSPSPGTMRVWGRINH